MNKYSSTHAGTHGPVPYEWLCLVNECHQEEGLVGIVYSRHMQ